LGQRPDARLLLVGGGPEDGRLRQLAATLGLRDSVVFTGRVPHSEVQKYYDLVDLLVYPRVPARLTDLVTPLKPLEAMALRKVIGACETGILCVAGDAGDLAACVLRVLDRRADWPRQIAAGRRFVESERSWPNSVARYRAVYERLLGGHFPPAAAKLETTS